MGMGWAAKTASEVLGPDSACQIDLSSILEGYLHYSGIGVNRLGYFKSCESLFRPDIDNSVSSDQVAVKSLADTQEYKKYYLVRIDMLFKVLKHAYIGMCVPEVCTPTDVAALVDSIVGVKNRLATEVFDSREYAKKNLNWSTGTYAWFAIIIFCMLFAGYATFVNQKAVREKKEELERQKLIGKNVSANQRRKTETHQQKEEKTHPSFFVNWDLVVNMRGLLYPMRVNSDT